MVRPSLLERLHGGVNGKVTLVSAPPGFGKTTLLAAWLAEEQNKKVARFSLDDDDNEPARFFAHLVSGQQ